MGQAAAVHDVCCVCWGAVETQVALVDGVELLDQTEDGGLACSRGPHDGSVGSLVGREAQIEDADAGFVLETHALELHHWGFPSGRGGAGPRVGFQGGVDDLPDTRQRRQAGLQPSQGVDQLRQGEQDHE